MPRLIIIAGPTAVGKTAHAIALARHLDTEILSCDSRQFYREMRIGVARPTDEELSAVRHHFIACRSVANPYNIYDYSVDARACVERLMQDHDEVVACGGSGLYIDALCQTPARLPDTPPELRAELQQMSLEEKRSRLRMLDPAYYARVDLRNPVRLQRALEVCLVAGRPYSDLLAEQQTLLPPYEVDVRVLQCSPTELRQRIDQRVDAMMAQGLFDEVRSLVPFRHLSTLNTVGYRELFPVVDGLDSLDHAVQQIKLNTWHYARKQLTWMKKYVHNNDKANYTIYDNNRQ